MWTTSGQHTGGVTEKKDQPEWMTDGRLGGELFISFQIFQSWDWLDCMEPSPLVKLHLHRTARRASLATPVIPSFFVDGHYLGHDGFVFPEDFSEFYERHEKRKVVQDGTQLRRKKIVASFCRKQSL